MKRYSVIAMITIWVTLLCAAFLQIMPLPGILDPFRPNWLLLVSLYWVIALPHRFNLGSVWLAGFILDLLWGATLGINALAFVLSTALVAAHFQKIRNFSIGHQALLMTGINVLYQCLSYVFELWLNNNVVMPVGYFCASLATVVAWPWLFLVLRKARRQWRIN